VPIPVVAKIKLAIPGCAGFGSCRIAVTRAGHTHLPRSARAGRASVRVSVHVALRVTDRTGAESLTVTAVRGIACGPFGAAAAIITDGHGGTNVVAEGNEH
jgi:hypothetical protein